MRTGNGPGGSFTYDPFGNVLTGSTHPANFDTGSLGYEGSHQKITETTLASLPMVMGARIYLPSLGRFTSMDPAPGGNANAYVYAVDSINFKDLSGLYACFLQCTVDVSVLQPSINSSRMQSSYEVTLQLRSVGTARVSKPTGAVRYAMRAISITASMSDDLSAAQNILKTLQLNDYQPLQGYQWDFFQNNEELLPLGEQYLEHDLYPFIQCVGRGASRLVVSLTSGRGWFTSDHYQNFTELLDNGTQDAEQLIEDVL